MSKQTAPSNEDIILIDKYIKSANESISDGSNYNYKGLRIHALEGLHEFIANKIRDFFKPNGYVLDLGSGTGAMSLRLSELGFKVTATDIVSENSRLNNIIPFVKINLNDFFSNSFDKHFDGIVAAEIIEHLENPRKFLRESYKLIRPGGKMILSTPNINNPVSKASFIRSGTYKWYYDADYKDHGHITPISQWLLHKCIAEAGFNIEWIGTFGDPFVHTKNQWKIKLFSRFIQLLSVTGKNLDGEILVTVLTKSMDGK